MTTLDITHLRGLTATQGALKLDQHDATKPAVIGNGAFGKLAIWFSDPGKTANKALKDNFLDTLERNYGKEFRTSHQAQVNAGSKPLSLRLVKDIIKQGDIELTGRASDAQQRQDKITQQNRSGTELLANAFSSPKQNGPDELPMRTALRGPAQECGLTDKLAKLTQDSGLRGAKDGGFRFKLDHINLPDGLRASIKQKILDAGENGAKLVTVAQAATITKDAIKDSGLLDRKLDFISRIEKRGDLTPAIKDAAIDAIVRNDYPTFQAFEKSYFHTAPSGEMHTNLYGGNVTAPKDNSNSSLKTVSTSLVNKAYDESTYNPGGFFDGVGKTGSAKDWSINRAIQSHFAQSLPQDGGTRAVLDQRGLVYMAKCAINAPVGHGQGTGIAPWQAGSKNTYYRGGTELTKQFVGALAKTVGVEKENLFAVTDSRVMDVLKRDFGRAEGNSVLNWKEQDLDKVMEQVLVPDGGKVLLDVTAFTAATTHAHRDNPENLKMAIEVANSFLHDALVAHAEDYVARHSGDNPAPTVKGLIDNLGGRIILGSTMQIGDQTMLYTRTIGHRGANNTYYEGVVSGLGEDHGFSNIINHSGFAVGPNQLIESWLKTAPNAESVATAIGQMMAGSLVAPGQVEFPSDVSGLASFATMKEFESTKIFKDFAAIVKKTDGSSAPHQTILGSATLGLLRGLEDAGVHAAFKKEGLEGMLQISLNRIQAAMQKAIAAGDDFRGFQEQIGIMHEEIATLLAVAKPVTTENFSTTMNKVAPLLPKDSAPEVTSHYQVTNSGMRSLASVMSGIEALKAGRGEGTALNIAFQSNSYYESSSYVLPNHLETESFKIDGRALDNSVGEMSGKIGGGKLDLYIAEFHHNISYDLDHYVAEPVKDQVDKLFATKGLVSDKFTVALDVTISKTDAPEIREFLAHNKERIEKGQLNVVFYRSGQKFDMGGMDNFNGGIMATVNNGDTGAWGAYNTSTRGKGPTADKVSDYNLQGLGAYQFYAQTELNAYRTGIIDNTAKLNKPESKDNPLGMPKEMFDTPENRGKMYLQIAVNDDPGAVFIDIRAPWMEKESEPYKTLLAGMQMYFAEHLVAKDPTKYQIEARPSFGFPHSNVSIIGGSKFRFNVGLESDSVLKNYKDALIGLNMAMGMTLEDYRDPAVFNKINAKLLDCPEGRKIVDTLTVQPDMTKLSNAERIELAVNFVTVGNLKAAARALDGVPLPASTTMPNGTRVALALVFATKGDHPKARDLIGKIRETDFFAGSRQLYTATQEAIINPRGDTLKLTTTLDDAVAQLRLELAKGASDRIKVMSLLGKAHDAAEKLGRDPERSVRELLSKDLKSLSAGQLTHFAKSLGDALNGLNDSGDPIERVMRSVKTFAEQDLELARRSGSS